MPKLFVWAPKPKLVRLKLGDMIHPMEGPDDRGYWSAFNEMAQPGMDYAFLLDEDPTPYPDPRSLLQRNGVHGPSTIFDQSAFRWDDGSWQPPPLSSAVMYELHIGTFAQDGTFDAAIERLPYLVELGITHIEVMPVAEFAGNRGWGYDGVDLFAVSYVYGGPERFKRFVNACHVHGLAVVLDVVYNHFGPVGNYTGKFGPYMTDKHHTPWGDAINFEDEGSDEVRQFFFDNALMWMRDFHIDGLRLDAIHEIFDRSAVHFLEELSARVDNLSATLGRRFSLIAESDLNNQMIVTPIEAKGFGLDAQWSDDFHHALFSLLRVEETRGYQGDFGRFGYLAKALKQMFVYDGMYSVYRGRSHGRPVDGLSAHRFVGFIQNHDQVGNRATGDRLHEIVGVPRTKVALGLVLTAPFVPMLFQGEEFAASTPFLYFADHEDEAMAKLVSEGRKREFAAFGWDESQIPNPEDVDTFRKSRLNWSEIDEGVHRDMLEWTRSLIRLRRSCLSLNDGDLGHMKIAFDEDKKWLRMDRHLVTVLMNLGEQAVEFAVDAGAAVVLTSDPAVTLEAGTATVPRDSIVIVEAEDEGHER
jgi:maltooligosyltrehalose trehalohydrolase